MEEKMEFTSFQELTTERLVLRMLKTTDENEIFILRSDDAINKYISRPKLKHKVEAIEFISNILDGIIKNKALYWAITFKESAKLIGTICLWNFSEDKKTAELGYELFPDFQGRGIMNEAIKKVIDLGFQTIGLKTIEAYTHKNNLKSRSLLLKNNFSPDITRIDEDNANNVIFVLMK